MSDRYTEKESSGFSAGFSTGLKLWLFFLLSFVLLGYSVPLSILLGAIAGLAGGWIIAWWKSTDEPNSSEPPPTEIPEEPPAKLSGLRLAKQKRDAQKKKRSRRQRMGD